MEKTLCCGSFVPRLFRFYLPISRGRSVFFALVVVLVVILVILVLILVLILVIVLVVLVLILVVVLVILVLVLIVVLVVFETIHHFTAPFFYSGYICIMMLSECDYS